MSRKRSSSDSDGSMERTPSKIQRACDPYCWLCHKKDTNQRCSTCNLSYHRQCIGVNGPKLKNYKCDLCERQRQAKEDYEKRNVDMKEFHRMLESVVKHIFKDKNFARLKSFDDREPVNGGPSIINPYNLDIVSEKVDDNQYKSTVEFLKDIRQIRHNAEIVSTDCMKRLTFARQLETWCAKEMYDIEICGQCFVRAMDLSDWFTEVCDPPHLMVWAKLAGYPYWPAKVIGITSSSNRIDVRFFGDHDMANVSAQDCFLYPSKNPNRRLDEHGNHDVKRAEKEAKKYIQKIEAKYNCTVRVFESRSVLVLKCVGQLLTTMIPNLNLPPNFKLKRKPSYLLKVQCHKSSTSPRPPAIPPPLSSLTPPPSPPPLPLTPPLSSSLPEFLPPTIKLPLSHDKLEEMNRFALKIRPCDDMPEFITALKKRTNDSSCSSRRSNHPDRLRVDDDAEKLTVDDLVTHDDQNNLNGSEIEFVEVDVVLAADLVAGGSFNSLVYSSSESYRSKNTFENENQPNVSISAEIHDIEVPSPPIEIDNATMEQSLLEFRKKFDTLKQQLEQEFKPEIQRLNGIINELRVINLHHIEDKIKMQTKIVQLKENLAKLQQQHSIELQQAIEDTKSKKWCANCKKEASITKYKIPVCSADCLLLVWQENMKRGERPASSQLGN